MRTIQVLLRASAVWLAALVLCLGVQGSALAGPVSPFYLTAANQQRIYEVQGGAVVRSWTTNRENESPLFITGSVRTITISGGHGSEYSLSGDYLGPTSVYPVGTEAYDGTTDGTHDYVWGYGTGEAYRFNPDGSGRTTLFSLGNTNGTRSGIAYDPTNNSLWLSGWVGAVGNLIEDRALDGTLLSEFRVGHDENAALALDPADGTLWLHDRNSFGQAGGLVFEQYSKTGQLLSTQVYSDLGAANILGGAFAFTAVPEPNSLLLACVGVFALLIHAGRRRSSRCRGCRV